MDAPFDKEEVLARVRDLRRKRKAREREQSRRAFLAMMREVRANNAYFTCKHPRTWTLDTIPEDINGLAIDSIRIKKCQDCKRTLEILL